MKKIYRIFFLILQLPIFIFLFSCVKNDKKNSVEVIVSTGTIKSGDILENIFKNKNFNKNDIKNIISTINKNYDIRKIFPKDYYEIFYTTFNTIVKFNYWLNPSEYFSVIKSSNEIFEFSRMKLNYKENLVIKDGEVEDYLWNAMIKQDITPETILNFTDIFSWQIDFLTEVRNGDKFKIAYKQLEYENGYKKDGNILAAKYSGKATNKHIAFYFESKDGNFKGYFSEDGKSVKKIFLRAPLNYRRISSGFTKKRFHPILRIFRPHHGTDFVAPIGTPIVSIGDGVIEYAGWKTGYGNVVIIRHNSTYKTLYGHLLKIEKNIKPKTKVFQGQLIGYLGSTGISTGPHLHFEIHVNNKPTNFFSLKFPPSESIPEKYKAEFEQTKQILLKYLEEKIN